MSLSGKVFVITGASKGIGKAIAERVARAGATVVVNYNTDSAAADAVVSSIGVDRAIAVRADVSTISGIDKLVAATVNKFGRIDVVIPNAGVLPMATIETTTEELFDQTFAINVKGPYFLVQKAIPHMAPGSGIILVSTGMIHNSAAPPPYLLYGATKSAIEAMVKFLAKGLAPKGINVNGIAPGPTGTELFFKGKSEQVVNHIKAISPFNKLGTPEDIANAVALLCNPEARWIDGQILQANGAAFV